MAKLQDKADMKCGEKSAVQFRSKKVKKIIASATSSFAYTPYLFVLNVGVISSLQIIDILPEELCPPEGTGESQELLLKLLCGVLSISIVVVLTKLGYDYTIYRRRGQLPWLALKMP